MRVFAGLLLVAVAVPAAQAADGTFERTFKVNGPVLLGVDTGAGNIRVSAGDSSTVHIVAHVHSSTGFLSGSGAADERVKQVVQHPPINQAGNIISLGHNFNESNISIDYTITVPRGTDLRADSGAGKVQADGIGGPTQLKTGAGDIEGTGLSDHVSLETGAGNITATMLSALDVKAQTGAGAITLSGVQSGVWAHTGAGTIQVAGRPLGGWRLETGIGEVIAKTGGAPLSLDARTGSGNIEYSGTLKRDPSSTRDHVLGEINGGGPLLRASSGSGNIDIQ